MLDYIRKHRRLTLVICILIAAAAIAAGYFLYRRNRINILDRAEYKAIAEDFRSAADAGSFTDQAALREFITSWADSCGLKYSVDSSDNIVFNTKAAGRKQKVSPSIVCVSYNYETAASNAELLASAAMIAKTDISSGRRTIIFVNDEQNLSKGYKGISKKYFSGKSKVIYLDQGATSYISGSSFGRDISSITITGRSEKVKYDTAVRIHISGVAHGEINSSANQYPDVTSEFSTLLTRLKSRSVTFQLADLEMGSDGLMYPSSIDATFILNSYAVDSFTKYIDKMIKRCLKTYSSDYPDLEYSYEIIDSEELIPGKAYSSDAVSKLANVLYTLKSGTYTFESAGSIPDGLSEEDVYGINRITDIRCSKSSIIIDLVTMAYNDEFMEGILNDNMAVSELFKCTYTVIDEVPCFDSVGSSLFTTMKNTYQKVNDISGKQSKLSEKKDDCFTPCSYLASIEPEADVIHIRLTPKRAAYLTNVILCYIATKGNFFSL